MKTINKMIFLFIAVFVFTGCVASRPVTEHPAIPERGTTVSMNLFYESLSPYGKWIDYRGYGNAWVPRVSRNFRPYATNGRWVFSDYGWTWMSGYSWGWAPFHYGRWTYDDYYGWIWIPGEVWAPAWVAWRQSSSYYGWAPLGPGMNINVNINIGSRYWNFVPSRYIASRNVHRYFTPRNKTVNIIHNTTIINNVYEQSDHRYFSGPTRRAVQQRTNQDVRPVRVFNSKKPSSSRLTSNGIRMYRPSISRDGKVSQNDKHNARPVRVARPSESRTTRSNQSSRREQEKSTRSTADNENRRISRENKNTSQNQRAKRRTTRPANTNTRTQQRTSQPREKINRRTNTNPQRRVQKQSPTRKSSQRPANKSSRTQRRTTTRPSARKINKQTKTPQRTIRKSRPGNTRSARRR